MALLPQLSKLCPGPNPRLELSLTSNSQPLALKNHALLLSISPSLHLLAVLHGGLQICLSTTDALFVVAINLTVPSRLNYLVNLRH